MIDILKKPWLWLPSELSHKVSPLALKAITSFNAHPTPEWQPFEWKNLKFKNRIGLAGGVDKSGKSLQPWWKLGPGFIEVGTITPEPQKANPGQIMNRDIAKQALWNKMGFPNPGARSVFNVVKKMDRPFPTPLFVNVGKNRWTPNEKAHEDYQSCLETFSEVADAFVINISSPNTKGLRNLQSGDDFKKLLQTLSEFKAKNKKPLLLKLSPDMSDEELFVSLDNSQPIVDGWILTNTTQSRPDGLSFPKEGGLSGAPLAPLAQSCLKKAVQHLGDNKKEKLIISAGGVTSSKEIALRLEIGADLVQTYSGIVFNGPFFFINSIKELRANHS